MHRQQLLAALNCYSDTWPKHPELCSYWDPNLENSNLSQICNFIQTEPHCFERSNQKGHLTGSALVTNSTFNKVLLTHHRKLGMWLQLGGHADGDGDLAKVALTEAKEESGIENFDFVSFSNLVFNLNTRASIPFDLDVHQIPASKTDPAHIHYDIRFLLCCDDKILPVISDESHDVCWFTLDRARELTQEPSMLRQFAKLETLARQIQFPANSSSLLPHRPSAT